MKKINEINKTPTELFDEARDRQIIKNQIIKQRAEEMRLNYQHWLWKELNIDEVTP